MRSLLGCMLAAVLATPTLAHTHDADAPLAMPCDNSDVRRLRVRLIVKSNQDALFTDAIQEIVNRTWGQAGLDFEWLAGSGPDMKMDNVDAWVIVAHAPLVTLPTQALGAVVFDERAVPSRIIRVSIDSVVAWVSQSQRARFHRFSGVLAPALGDTALLVPRALGYAAAHEVGHFVLATKDHAPSGLMQAALTTPRALFDADSFVLDAENRQRLSTRLLEHVVHCRDARR